MYWDSDTYLLYNSFDKHYLKNNNFYNSLSVFVNAYRKPSIFSPSQSKSSLWNELCRSGKNIVLIWEP